MTHRPRPLRVFDTWEVAAVVLEVDGVLVDTWAAHRATWSWWARRVGIDPATASRTAAGRVVTEAVGVLAPGCDVDREAAAIDARDATLARSMTRVRHARTLLRQLPGRRHAVVSPHTDTALHRRRTRGRLPDSVVALRGDELASGPPAPGLVSEAVDRLRHPAADTLALVWSPAMADAASAAGVRTVGIGPLLAEQAPAGVEAVADDLDALRVTLTASGVQVRATRAARRLG